MSGRLVLEAIGGLGNRMRALDSAIGFCRKYDKDLYLIWPFFKGLNCPFEKLFEKPDIVQSISSPSEYSTYKITRNLKVTKRKITRQFYRFIYDRVIGKNQVYALMDQNYDFGNLAQYENIRMQTDQKFLK